MKTDYKFWYIQRLDNVHISSCAVRFYEGDITTENEQDRDGNFVPVTRYRRTKRLRQRNLHHLKNRKFKAEGGGGEAVIFTDKDFGVISTDDELRSFLNKELRKDRVRKPIKEQRI